MKENSYPHKKITIRYDLANRPLHNFTVNLCIYNEQIFFTAFCIYSKFSKIQKVVNKTATTIMQTDVLFYRTCAKTKLILRERPQTEETIEQFHKDLKELLIDNFKLYIHLESNQCNYFNSLNPYKTETFGNDENNNFDDNLDRIEKNAHQIICMSYLEDSARCSKIIMIKTDGIRNYTSAIRLPRASARTKHCNGDSLFHVDKCCCTLMTDIDTTALPTPTPIHWFCTWKLFIPDLTVHQWHIPLRNQTGGTPTKVMSAYEISNYLERSL